MPTPNLAPGEKMSNVQRAALARDNERETRQAMEMAGRQREEDMRSGRVKPVDQVIAEGIKGKLERGEFHKK